MILNEALLIFFIVLFALCIGSFLNVVIHRLPHMLISVWRVECQEMLGQRVEEPRPTFNLVWPRSQCVDCKTTISWWANIPLLSYVFLRGRCYACKTHISLRYPIIELLAVMMALLCYAKYGASIAFLGSSVLGFGLIAAAAIDIEHQLLPDQLILPLLWLGLILNAFGVYVSPSEAILGATVAYSALWLFAHLFTLLAKKEGMGHGDFKCFALFGAWLGYKPLLLILLLATLVGAIVGILWLTLTKQGKDTPLPFGPYLIGAGLIAMLWGDTIMTTYMAIAF